MINRILCYISGVHPMMITATQSYCVIIKIFSASRRTEWVLRSPHVEVHLVLDQNDDSYTAGLCLTD